MINDKLFAPDSIVIVGASENVSKPGGKTVKNLVDSNFKGKLYGVNPRQANIDGIEIFPSVQDLPNVDLAILAVPAPLCVEACRILTKEKSCQAIIVISAGFSELNADGARLEQEMVDLCNSANACLIGPNCIGVMTSNHASVFTTPVPKLQNNGIDFISGSGATAVFIIESGVPKGLSFNSVITVGNSAQIGVEDVLEYFDKTFDSETSSRIKILYVENISNPDKFLYHASSLSKKGCKIAAIKAGSSDAGSRAASSHTGAMASSDQAVDALFRKAGIVRCYGREELTTVACAFMCKELTGKNMAIITHAGGPAVMLTDALESGGLTIPAIKEGEAKKHLLGKLAVGSTVENPIDFLATGSAQNLKDIIDACENDFDEIDAMAVIFGSPGLFAVRDVYDILHQKMKTCKKPIYPILPSVINVKDDVAYFLSHGNVNFPDEVLLGTALTKIYNTPKPSTDQIFLDGVDVPRIRKIIDETSDGYQSPEVIHQLFEAASIPMAKERVISKETDLEEAVQAVGFPLVMKVVGPVHKTDVGGVTLNIHSMQTAKKEFKRMLKIKDATGVLLAEMLSGTELFIGAKYEPPFGHIVLCGLGGIFVEAIQDITSGLAPLSFDEANSMINGLRGYKMLEGFRGTKAVDKHEYASIIVRLSSMLRFATEIKEIDINPLLAEGNKIVAVDARIRIEK